MNWHPVKSVLLILLLLSNLFLLATTAGGRIERERQYAASAAQAASLLSQSGIEIDEAILAVRESAPLSYTFAAARTDLYCAAAERFLGCAPAEVFLLPDGLLAKAGERAVRLAYDGRILFPAGSDDLSLPTGFDALPPEKDAYAAEKRLLYALTLSDADTLAVRGCAKGGDTVYFNCQSKLGDLPVFACDCVFGVKDGKLTAADGKLFLAGGARTSVASPCLDRVNIMLSELRRGATGRVTGMTLCYAIFENAEKDKTYAYPAYEIVYENAGETQSVCVCALDGERCAR